MPTHDPDKKPGPMYEGEPPKEAKTSDEAFASELADPFPPECVEWRVGTKMKDGTKGMALAYLTARAVMDRLDAVCGPGLWSDEYREISGGRGFICRLGVKFPETGWRCREDGSDESDIEGVKGGLSGALKRAAVKFGIGRYLYSLDAPWVPLRAQGRSHVIDGPPPKLPTWALPGGSGRPPAPKAAARATKPKAKAEAPPTTAVATRVKGILSLMAGAQTADELTRVWGMNKEFVSTLPQTEQDVIINAGRSRKHDFEVGASQ